MSATTPLAVARAFVALVERQDTKLPGPGDSDLGLRVALDSDLQVVLKPLAPLESDLKGFTICANAVPDDEGTP